MKRMSLAYAAFAAAWVLVVGAVLGAGSVAFHKVSTKWTERDALRQSVAETSAALNDFIDATTDSKSAITYKETFDLADEEIRRAGEASIKVQVADIPKEERAAVRAYLAGVTNMVRLCELESRKGLAYSGSNSAVEEAIAQARSANSYVADAYISNARRALGDMSKAAQERAAAEKDRKEYIKAFRARLAKLRPALAGYAIVEDASLGKLDPPDQVPKKT